MDAIHEAESWILSSSVPRSYGENPHHIRSVRLVLVCKSHCVQTKRIVESLCWEGVCALAVDGWWRGGRLRGFRLASLAASPAVRALSDSSLTP